jgi:dihydropteroate synthase
VRELGSLFQWGSRTYVMGVLNVTEDSFSGDGLLTGGADLAATVLERGRAMMAAGADILDLGAESTRPGSTGIDVGIEAERVALAVRVLRAAGLDVPLSVDTARAPVARAALENGADIINDISGLARDPALLDVLVEYGAGVVLTHSCIDREQAVFAPVVGGSYRGPATSDIVADTVEGLAGLISRAVRAGLAERQIIVDPGIGLGKNTAQNIELTARLDALLPLGRPILYGPSRKAFIGEVLDLPVQDRREGTAAAVAVGIGHGADIVRVHDVREMARVARMADALVRRPVPVPVPGPAQAGAGQAQPVLNYLAIKCVRLEACLAFYSALGFEFEPEVHSQVPLHHVARKGDQTLELHGAAARGEPTGDGTRLGLAVADLPAAVAAAVAAGAVLQRPPQEGPWGLRAVLVDPDGRRVELTPAG